MEQDSTKYFFLEFFNNFYVHESRRTLITGSKDYNIYKGIIESFLMHAISDDLEELKKELYTLENSFYKNYARDLLVKFKNKIDAQEFDNLKTEAQSGKYLDVINQIEKKFDFVFNNDLILRNDNTHPNESCKTTVSNMINAFKDFIDAKAFLQTYSLNSSIIDIDVNTEEYFILKVIYSEFWNFLSHMSFALSYDEGIQNYEDNINRATRHLERAILDIYKFIIVSMNLVDETVLIARNSELKSFGNASKISKAYVTYKNLILKLLNT